MEGTHFYVAVFTSNRRSSCMSENIALDGPSEGVHILSVTVTHSCFASLILFSFFAAGNDLNNCGACW